MKGPTEEVLNTPPVTLDRSRPLTFSQIVDVNKVFLVTLGVEPRVDFYLRVIRDCPVGSRRVEPDILHHYPTTEFTDRFV